MARIVDVGHKPAVRREAEARGRLALRRGTVEALRAGKVEKGDPAAVAQAAGLLAVKRTPDLLPLCHPIPLSGATLEVLVRDEGVEARCVVRAEHTTGVEMEALTGCAVALLTVWDMVKSLEKDDQGQYPTARIEDLRVVRKEKGGARVEAEPAHGRGRNAPPRVEPEAAPGRGRNAPRRRRDA